MLLTIIFAMVIAVLGIAFLYSRVIERSTDANTTMQATVFLGLCMLCIVALGIAGLCIVGGV